MVLAASPRLSFHFLLQTLLHPSLPPAQNLLLSLTEVFFLSHPTPQAFLSCSCQQSTSSLCCSIVLHIRLVFTCIALAWLTLHWIAWRWYGKYGVEMALLCMAFHCMALHRIAFFQWCLPLLHILHHHEPGHVSAGVLCFCCTIAPLRHYAIHHGIFLVVFASLLHMLHNATTSVSKVRLTKQLSLPA